MASQSIIKFFTHVQEKLQYFFFFYLCRVPFLRQKQMLWKKEQYLYTTVTFVQGLKSGCPILGAFRNNES